MKILKNHRNILFALVTASILILCGILATRDFDDSKIISRHIEQEKDLGDSALNRHLYNFYDTASFKKLILTDYQYLWVLPDINIYFRDCRISDLKPSDQVLRDEAVGYLLWTPAAGEMKEVPAFIESGIQTGRYREIVTVNGCRFIKIR